MFLNFNEILMFWKKTSNILDTKLTVPKHNFQFLTKLVSYCLCTVPEFESVSKFECGFNVWISDNFRVPEYQHDMFLNFPDFNTTSMFLNM